jgi:hypothetical protein
MADEVSANTFEYTIAGRTMTFHKTTRAQLMMIQRLAIGLSSRLRAEQEGSRDYGDALGQFINLTFEAAESRFTSAEDLAFVQTEIIRGNVDEDDIMGILANGVRPQAIPDDDAEPAAPKRARKAAPKKAPGKPASRRAAR